MTLTPPVQTAGSKPG